MHLQPRPHAGEERRLDDGAEHRAVVDDLLELDQNLLAGAGVGLAGLLGEEAVDLGIRPVGEVAAGDGVLLDASRRVAGHAALGLHHVTELLLRLLLEEGRALDQAQPRANAHRLEKASHRLADRAAVDHIARELTRVEPIRISGLGQKLLRPGHVVGVRGRRPVVLHRRGDEAGAHLAEPEIDGLVDGLAIDGMVGGQAHPAVVPGRPGIPLVGEEQPHVEGEDRRHQREPRRAP